MTVEQGRNYMYHQQHRLVFSKSVKFQVLIQVVLLWDHERRRCPITIRLHSFLIHNIQTRRLKVLIR